MSQARAGILMLGLVGFLDGCGGPSTSAPPSTEPYVLFAPIQSNVTYLMDLQGQLVHQWRADSTPACTVALLSDGRLLRPQSLGDASFPSGGCNGGRIQLLDWSGSVLWSFDYSSPDHQQHHDVRWMPNGHVLFPAWEKRTAAEALAVGRDPATIPANGEIWVDHLVEVDPASNSIVWTWHAWDHLLPPGENPADHPELVDPNAWATPQPNDWTHANAVDYNPALDQVMVSVRNHSEVWVIDHGTTTAEAAGHTGGRRGRGGDLLYRWGNPLSYGYPDNRQLFGQHNAHWIESGLSGEGQVLVFDNGDASLRPFSRVVQFAPPLQPSGLYDMDPASGFLPTAPSWLWTASHFFEVTTAGDTTWSYLVTDTNGKNSVLVFRATRYEAGYPALDGRSLIPQGPVRVELNPPATGSEKLPPL